MLGAWRRRSPTGSRTSSRSGSPAASGGARAPDAARVARLQRALRPALVSRARLRAAFRGTLRPGGGDETVPAARGPGRPARRAGRRRRLHVLPGLHARGLPRPRGRVRRRDLVPEPGDGRVHRSRRFRGARRRGRAAGGYRRALVAQRRGRRADVRRASSPATAGSCARACRGTSTSEARSAGWPGRGSGAARRAGGSGTAASWRRRRRCGSPTRASTVRRSRST